MVRGSILIMPIRAKYEWENNFLNETVSVKILARFISLSHKLCFKLTSDGTSFNSIYGFLLY